MAHEHDVKGNKLLLTILLNIVITIAEFVGGLLSNSLALISDAVHNLTDVLALVFSFVSRKIALKKADKKRTFGYKRAEILTALLNASILFGISIFLISEAWERFQEPSQINAVMMLVVAGTGLLANLVSMLILHGHKKGSLNIKSAYLHMLGDTLSSVAVIIGGLLIWIWDIYWIDPLITILVAIYLITESWRIIRQSANILMQASPDGADLHKISQDIEQIAHIKGIHHVHIWQLDENDIHFESHIELQNDLKISECDAIRTKIDLLLKEKYKINHTTYQFEYVLNHERTLLKREG